ncbi:MAG: CcoQ/FixQ family Cbb3-type cytochrome c oxidase assembly chaperone [Gammaproteobacteria bacterium]|nr:CcoQ/FixQ family Cbb3-type cytochrome c oxidase assembly chaperone [Gammaproteobacteria bacterium]
MDVAVFHGLWTGALLVIFIGIVVWAWSGKRKQGFDEAAHIPLADDELESSGAESKRNEYD